MDFYAPWNKRLADLLGDVSYLEWNEVPPTAASAVA